MIVPRIIWAIASKFTLQDLINIFLLFPFAVWLLQSAFNKFEVAKDVAAAYSNFFASGLGLLKIVIEAFVKFGKGQYTKKIRE